MKLLFTVGDRISAQASNSVSDPQERAHVAGEGLSGLLTVIWDDLVTRIRRLFELHPLTPPLMLSLPLLMGHDTSRCHTKHSSSGGVMAFALM